MLFVQLEAKQAYLSASVDTTAITANLNQAPVIFKDKFLFFIYGYYGPYSPFERAATITQRLEYLAENSGVYADSLNIVKTNEDYNLRHGSFVIMTVSPADTIEAGKPIAELTNNYLQILKNEFIPLLEKVTLKSTLIGIAKIVITMLILSLLLIFVIKLINRLFKWIIKHSLRLKEQNQAGVYLRGIRLLTNEQIDTIFKVLLKMLKFVIIVVLLYIVLYVVLLTLPFTRGIAHKLQGYITTPLLAAGKAVLNFIPNIFFIAIIVLFAKYTISLLKYIAEEIGEERLKIRGFYPEWSKPTFQIAKFLTFFFVAIIIFPYLPGSSSPAFKGISVFVGVLFSLGSSSAIANMIAGIMLTYMRPYKIGDMIKIGDKFGCVKQISLLTIRLKTTKNEEITIPNSLILSGHIINYTRNNIQENLLLHTSITIGYDTPWRNVHELLIKAAGMTEGILADAEPFVLQTSLNDYYVAYELNAYTNQPELMPRIYSQLHQNIQDCFRDANVEIMSPSYTSFRNGNQSTIPRE